MSSEKLARAVSVVSLVVPVLPRTGAGISADGGVSTRRGLDGLRKHCEVPACLEYGLSVVAALPASGACR
jgi:hypothetical protein